MTNTYNLRTLDSKAALLLDKNSIVSRLHALSADDKVRSKTARLRDVFSEIEATLATGVSQIHVLQALKADGLEMSLGTFTTTLRRIRIESRKTIPAHKDSKAAPQSNAKTPASSPLGEEKGSPAPSHDPADLNKILATVPDLAALARLAKKGTKK